MADFRWVRNMSDKYTGTLATPIAGGYTHRLSRCYVVVGVRQLLLRCSISCIHAVVAHPDHLLFVGSRGFAHLSPSSTLKSNGYIGHSLSGNSLFYEVSDKEIEGILMCSEGGE